MATHTAARPVLSSKDDTPNPQPLTQGALQPPTLPPASAGAVSSQHPSTLTFQTGDITWVRIEAGRHYKIRRALQTEGQNGLETPDNVIASRQGDALQLRYADGSKLTLDDFYRVCTSDAVCSVNLVSDDSAGITLAADNAMGGAIPADGGTLVYAHGQHDVLLSMAQGQAPMLGTLGALGDAPLLTYLPQASQLAPLAAHAAAGFGESAVVPGLVGLLLAGSGLSGVTASGAGPLTATVNSIVQGTIQAGPITAGNDLEVSVYAADGRTVLKAHVAVDSNGHFSTDIGNYVGVVFAKLFNKGVALDYLDEATGAGKDLSTPLMAMGVVSAPGLTLSLNLNALTTVAVNKMGAQPTTAVVEAVNAAVAQAFGLTTLQETTVVPTNSNQYVAADGLSEGEKYGAVLAGLSGMDKLNGGSMQTTLDQVTSQIAVAGTTATLTDSIKYAITAGAKVVAAAPTNQPVVTTQFGDAVATLIDYVANPVTQSQGLTTIGNTASTSTTSPAPTLFDYANANVTGIDNSTKLQLINDVVKTKAPSEVATVAAVQTLSDATIAVLRGAAGGTPPTQAQLQDLGITGVNSSNLQAVQDAIAATADDGSGVDTQAELQALVNGIVDTGLAVISAYAEANRASAPASPSGTAPGLSHYRDAGVSGVDDSNRLAINDALTSPALQGNQANTTAKVQAIVDAYQAILTEANGAAADATPGANPSAAQYAAIGADIGGAASNSHGLALLNDIIGAQERSSVDTVGEVNNLARIANAVSNQAAGIPGLSLADLSAIGITGLGNLSPGNIQNVLNAISASADDGSGIDSLTKIQALVDGAVDLIAPATPTAAPSGYADNAGRVQSLSSSAATTDDTTPGLHIGSLPADARGAILYVNGSPVAASYDPVSGTLTPTTPLGDGPKTLRYSLTDAAGNESGQSPALDFSIDTTAPATPSAAPAGYADNVGADQSSNSTAPSTDDSTPGLPIGSLPAGANGAVLYVDGVAVSSQYDPATGSLTPSVPLREGSHNLRYSWSNAAGNESGQSPALTLTLDSTPPATPARAPDGYQDNTGPDQNSQSTATATDDSTPGIHIGSLPGGATGAVLYVDGTPVASSYDPVTGTLTPDVPLVDGKHSLTYSLTDAAGNQSGPSPALTVGVDTSVPTAPVIDTVATDDTINASEQAAVISGSAQANALITLTLGSGNTHQITADAAGQWRYTLQPADLSALGQGLQTLSATATDAAGNVSAATSRSVTIDTLAPTLTVHSISGDGVLDAVEYAALASTPLALSGSTSGVEDGQSVTLSFNNLQYSSTVSGNSWSVNLPTADAQALNHGNRYSASASVSDAAGNVSNVGSADLLINIAAPDIPTVHQLTSNNSTPVLSGHAEKTLDGGSTFLKLAAATGDQLSVTVNSVTYRLTVGASSSPAGLGYDSASGDWTLDLGGTTPLADGSYEVAVSVQAGGTTKTDLSHRELSINTAPVLLSIASITSDDTVNAAEAAGTVLIHGTASNMQAGRSVELTLVDGSHSTATVQADGSWSTRVNGSSFAGEGAQHLTVNATNAAGSSATPLVHTLSVDTLLPTATLALDSSMLSAGQTATLTIRFSEAVSGLDTNDLSVGNGTLGPLNSSDGGRTWTATFTPASERIAASNSISLNQSGVSDAAGNAGVGSARSGNYAIDTHRPSATIALSDNALIAGETATVTLTFSEAVSGFDNSDLQFSNGTLSAVRSSDGGISWTAVFTPAADFSAASNTLTLDTSGVRNAAGNAGLGQTQSVNYAIDTHAPLVTAVSDSTPAALTKDAIAFSVTFDEPIAGIPNASHFSASNGDITAVSAVDSSHASVVVSPHAGVAAGSVALRLVGTGLSDAAGNPLASADLSGFDQQGIDTLAPAAPLLQPVATDDTVSLAEASAGLALSGTGEAGATLTLHFDSGRTLAGGNSVQVGADGSWTLPVSSADFAAFGQGAERISATLTDSAGNSSAVASRDITVDTAPPPTPAAPTSYSDNRAPLQSPASSATSTDDASPGLNVGAGLANTPTLYVDGVPVAASYDPITGTLTPSVPLLEGNHTHAPLVTTVSDSTLADVTRDTITFSVSFDEAIASSVSTSDFSASNGTVSSVTAVDSRHYSVVVTPLAGVASGAVALSLAGARLSDAAGNLVAGADLSGFDQQGIDTLAPAVSSVTDNIAATVTRSSISFTVSFDGAVTGNVDTSHFSASNGSVTAVTALDSSHFTVVVIPDANVASGDVALRLIGSGLSDATGNPVLDADLGSKDRQTIDTLAPTAPVIALVALDDVINLAEAGSTITGSCEIGATVALSLGGSTRAASVSGTSWSYTLQAADLAAMGQGPETLSATQTDAVGNVSAAGSRAITVDTVAPVVSAVSDSTATVTKDPITFSVTFSEPIAGSLDSSHFSASNGTVTSVLAVDSTHCTVVVTPSANLASGTVALSVVGTSLGDAAGNPLASANLSGFDAQAIDTLAPTVSAVTDATATALTKDAITFTVTFSEAIAGAIGTSHFSATNGSVASVTALDSTHCSVVVTPTAGIAAANVALNLIGTGLSDAAGNAVANSSLGALDSQGIDTLAPSVNAVTDATAAALTKDAISFSVSFDEALVGTVGTANFSASNGSVTSVTALDSSHYAVLVTPNADVAAGNVALSLIGTGLSDATGNAVLSTSLAGLDSQGIDTRAPTVSTVTDATAAAITKDAITFTVAFGEALSGPLDSSHFSATNGSVSSVSAIDSTHTSVVVTPTPGIAAGTVALSLNGTGLSDAVGNAVVSTSLGALDSQGIDTHAPVVTDVTDTTVATITHSAISFSVVFDEALVGSVGSGNFSASNGSVTSVTTLDSTHYTVLVTPTAGLAFGTVALTLIGTGLTDAVGNAVAGTSLAALDSQDMDTLAPSVTAVSDATAAAITRSAISFTVTFSEALSGSVGIGNFSASNGSVTAVTALDSTHCTVLVTPDANVASGSVALTLIGTGLSDAAGNALAGASLAGFDSQGIDTLAPAAPLISLVAGDDRINLTETGSTLTGSCEAGSSVTLSLGGNTRAATVSGSSWSYTLVAADLSAMGEGPQTLSATQTDATGNTSAAGSRSITVDTVAPIVTAVSDATVAAITRDAISFSVTLSEALAGSLGSGDFSASNGSVTQVSMVDSTHYTVLVTPTPGIAAGTVALSLLGTGQGDTAGNPLAGGSLAGFDSQAIDTLAPALTISSDVSSLQSGQTASITFTFSEDPLGSFAWDGSSGDVTVSGGTLGALSGTGLTRTATFTPTPDVASGSAQISVAAGSYSDTLGNTGDAAAMPAIAIHTQAPSVVSVAFSGATGALANTLNTGDVVTATATMSTPISVTGTPTLELSIGGTPVTATYVSGSGSSALLFSYTIQAGQNDADGLSVAANSLLLAGGTLKDSHGNDATLTHALVPDNAAYLVDTTAPTLSVSTPPATSLNTVAGTAGDSTGETIVLSIAFDSNVNGLTGGSDSSIFTVAGSGVSASWSGADGSSTRTLTYTVQAGQNGQAAIDEAALKAALIAGISDLAGNAFSYTGHGGVIANIDSTALPVIDTTAPTLSISTPPVTSLSTVAGSAGNSAGETIVLTLNFDGNVNGLTGGTDSSIFTVAGSGVSATWAGTTGTNTRTLTYTVQAGQNGQAALDEAALKAALIAGISDAAGNAFSYTANGGVIANIDSTPLPVVDTTAPTLSGTAPSTSLSTVAGTAGNSAGESIVLTVTFDGNVNGLTGGSDSSIFTVAGSGVSATWAGTAGSSTRTLSYTVQAGQNGQAALDEAALKAALIAGISDAAGNVFSYTANGGVIANIDSTPLPIVDTAAPTLSSTAPTTSLSTVAGTAGNSAGETIVLTLTFDGNVNGLTGGSDSSIFTVAGTGAAASWSGADGSSTRTLTYTVQAGQNGQAAIDEAALKTSLIAGISDAAGNVFSYTANGGVIANIDSTALPVIDTTAPTLSISTPPATSLNTVAGTAGNSAGETIVLTLTFDGNVNGLTSGSDSTIFTVAGTGVAASWSGADGSSTRTLTYTVQAGQNGQAALDEAALKAALIAGISDTAGNAFSYTANGGVIANIDSTPLPVVDTTAPTLSGTAPSTSLSTVAGSAGNSAGETIVLTVTFDGNLNGLTGGTDSSIFSVAGSGVSASWAGIAGSNTRTLTYTVQAGQNGQAALDEAALKAALIAGISDTAGNAFSYTANGGTIANIDSTPLPVIDTTAPTLSLGTPPATSLNTVAGTAGNSAGETIVLTLTFDGNVNGLTSGSDSTIFTVAGTGVAASWSGADGSSTRTLTYTVQAGQNGQAALDEVAMKTALIAGISDAPGNAFSYTANGGVIANIDSTALPVIDTTAPTLSGTAPSTSLSTVAGSAGNSAGETIVLTVTFDGNVNGLTGGTDSSIFTVEGSGVSASWSGADGSSTRTLTYTVQAGQSGQAALDEAALKAALIAGISDAAGNAFSYTANGGVIANIDSTALPVIDTTAPTLSISTPPATSLSMVAGSAGNSAGETIVLTVTFDGNVNGLTGGSDSTIFTVAGTGLAASWSGADGSSTRTLTYTVQAGQDGQAALDEAALKAALIAGISDTAGNAFSYTANGGVIANIDSILLPVIDTTAPTLSISTPPATSLSTVAGTAGNSAGETIVLTVTFNNDGNTNVAIVNVSGLDTNATWEYQVDGGAWTAGTSTAFTLTNLAHTYAVRQTDLAGNLGPVSTAKSYTLDTVAPTQTVAITTYTDNAATGSTGNFASGTSTDDTTPVLNGTVSATLLGTDVVRIYDNGTYLGNATVSGTTWTYATPTLTDGSAHSYTATIMDLAGNENAGSSALALKVSSPYERLTNASITGSSTGWTFNATVPLNVYYNGGNAIGFNAGETAPGGSAYQTLNNLIVGQMYTVQYELGFDGNTGTHTMEVNVQDGATWNAGTTLATQTTIKSGAAGLTQYTFDFTASSNTATLVFTNTAVLNTVGTDVLLTQASVMTQDEKPRHAATPLVLDLNGDGVQTTTVDQGALFDVANTGALARTAWVNASDGLLVRDINHDGVINNGAELFGNGTLLAEGSHAANGFDALAQLDANHDGKIDAEDAVFAELKVWRDANGDGVSQATELHSLQDLGIASFNLSATANNTGDNGNLHGLVSSYTSTDGSVHELADVWFQQGAQFTLDTSADGWNYLHLAAHAQGLDLSTVATTRLQGIHVIDLLSNQTADSLHLDAKQVLDLGHVNWLNAHTSGLTGGTYAFDTTESRHQLLVAGDATDQLTTSGGFVDTGRTAIMNGHTYEVYNQGSFAQLLVEQSINRTAVV